MMKKKTIVINGANIHDIDTFYQEINHVFMTDEDWDLGPSLDAFDDMLYGSYGNVRDEGQTEIIWKDIAYSQHVLGIEATRLFYEKKLMQPDIFDGTQITKKIDNLNNGTGQTYFDIIIEIIESHDNIVLIKQ